uniref:Sushi domain-containing protein n=1 Tax=Neogobius melanostomus TaxID=47308 RepID=A0A8C6TLJ8_9GOBI
TRWCPMSQPALGFQQIIYGNGTDVGTVIALHCPDKHKLIGDSVKCVKDANGTYWAGNTYCKPLSYNETHGFQLAVLLSIVSSAIILLMSMVFITRCLVNCIEKSKRKEMHRLVKLSKYVVSSGFSMSGYMG